jgi:hypothetical protein
MPISRDFRFLAQRAELGFFTRPSLFRRLTWLAAAILSIAAIVGAALAMGRKRTEVFSAGPVTFSHRMFEQDCAKCHDKWGPVERFASMNHSVPSTPNSKCVECHVPQQYAHQANLNRPDPELPLLLCANCHREHRHQQILAVVADSFCTDCHSSLKDTNHGGTDKFEDIRSFEESPKSGSHPEFALHRLLKQSGAIPEPRLDDLKKVLDKFIRDEGQGTPPDQPSWQDRGRIRFNHKVHLAHPLPVPGPVGEERQSDNPQTLDLSQNCEVCHKTDSAGRYMLPIKYEQHCAQCHPLWFDEQSFPGETVPHREPRAVHDYLFAKYLNRVLADLGDDRPAEGGADPLRKLPFIPRLPMEVTEQVERTVDDIERGMPVPLTAARAEHTTLKGCRYCHEVTDPSPGKLWEVRKPGIPERWLEHSQFRHSSHPMLDCRYCHADVDKSSSTGDVLLPEIDLCRRCHTEKPTWDGSRGAKPPGAGTSSAPAGATSIPRQGARTLCVECHLYHHTPKSGTSK